MSVEAYDNFALSNFLNCRRKYWWRINQSLVPQSVASPARGFGAAFHRALESWYEHHDTAKAASAFSEEWAAAGLVGDEKRNEQLGERVLGEYILKYSPEWFTTEHVEVGFSCELHDFIYHGRIDLIGIDKFTGNHIVVDHKTSSRKPSSVEVKHRQITGYVWAANELYEQPVKSAILNYVVLTKEPQFIRILSTRTDEQIEDWKTATIKIVEEIRRCQTYEDFFCNQEMCNHYGQCDYLDLCNCPASVRDRAINQKYTVSEWKPYLEEGNESNPN